MRLKTSPIFKVVSKAASCALMSSSVLSSLKSSFEGNKLIPKEGLEQGLGNAGLSVGDVLKQATLQGVANELQQQYISQGYYNSNIESRSDTIRW